MVRGLKPLRKKWLNRWQCMMGVMLAKITDSKNAMNYLNLFKRNRELQYEKKQWPVTTHPQCNVHHLKKFGGVPALHHHPTTVLRDACDKVGLVSLAHSLASTISINDFESLITFRFFTFCVKLWNCIFLPLTIVSMCFMLYWTRKVAGSLFRASASLYFNPNTRCCKSIKTWIWNKHKLKF